MVVAIVNFKKKQKEVDFSLISHAINTLISRSGNFCGKQ